MTAAPSSLAFRSFDAELRKSLVYLSNQPAEFVVCVKVTSIFAIIASASMKQNPKTTFQLVGVIPFRGLLSLFFSSNTATFSAHNFSFYAIGT